MRIMRGHTIQLDIDPKTHMEIFWRFKFSSFLLPGLILEAREGGGLLSASLHCTDFQFLLGLLGQLQTKHFYSKLWGFLEMNYCHSLRLT